MSIIIDDTLLSFQMGLFSDPKCSTRYKILIHTQIQRHRYRYSSTHAEPISCFLFCFSLDTCSRAQLSERGTGMESVKRFARAFAPSDSFGQ